MRVRRNLLYLGALLLVPLSTFAAFNLTPFRIEGGWGFLFDLTILTVAGVFTVGLLWGLERRREAIQRHASRPPLPDADRPSAEVSGGR